MILWQKLLIYVLLWEIIILERMTQKFYSSEHTHHKWHLCLFLGLPFGCICYQVQAHTAPHMVVQKIKRWVVRTRNSNFIWKASRLGWWTSVPENHLTRVRIQASLIIKLEGVWLVAANFLVLEPFGLSCPGRSGYNVPINLQQDKCYSLLCNILSLNEWKSVLPLRSEPWEWVILCISGSRQHSIKVQSQND